MRLTMKTRRELTRDEAVRYRKASRKEKSVILTHFVRITSYNRFLQFFFASPDLSAYSFFHGEI